MSTPRCCVCDREIEPGPGSTIGGRAFCAEHRKRVEHASRFSWWRSGVVEAGLTLAFVLLVTLTLGGTRLPVWAGIALPIVPSAIWIAHVYRQDQLEPEPPGLVVIVFFLAGLLTWSIALPLSRAILGLAPALGVGGILSWVGELGVDATLYVATAYLAMRCTVYLSSELDEPIDVLVYLCAAASGVAFVRNLNGILGGGGVLADNASAIKASNVLVCVAGVMPMALGLARQRFFGAGGLTVAGAFLGSVLVQGILSEAVLAFGSRGERFHPAAAIALAAVLAGIVIVSGHALTRRLAGRHLLEGTVARRPRFPGLLRLDGAVLAVTGVLLAGSGVYLAAHSPGAQTLNGLGGRVSLTLPRGWVGEASDGALDAGPVGLDLTSTHLRVSSLPGDPVDGDLALLKLEEERRRTGYAYRVLRTEHKAAFGSENSVWTWFAMVVDPPAGGNTKVIPEVIRGADVVVPADRLSISIWGPAPKLSEEQITTILSGVEVRR